MEKLNEIADKLLEVLGSVTDTIKRQLIKALIEFYAPYFGREKTKKTADEINRLLRAFLLKFFNRKQIAPIIDKLIPIFNDILEFTAPNETAGVLSSARAKVVRRTTDLLTKGIAKDMVGIFRKITQVATTTDISLKQATELIRQRGGRFAQYATQIARDAVFSTQRTVQVEIAKKYKYNAYRFTGSLIGDSRPACKYIVNKLNRIIKIEDLPQIVATIKRQYPQGLYKNFGVDTFLATCCGYNCRHILTPINV